MSLFPWQRSLQMLTQIAEQCASTKQVRRVEVEGSRVEGRRKTGEEAGKSRCRKCSSSLSVEFGLVLLRVPQAESPAPRAHPHSSRGDPGAFPHVECLLFLDLQKRWLTTPLGHVNRGSSFLTLIPPTFWGTSLSLFGEHPTEGLDVTRQKT